MSRESKLITAKEFDTQTTITHYESFGWELLSINGNQITMSRETQNPVFTDLVKHQAQYETLLQKYRSLVSPIAPVKPHPFSFKTCFLTFVLLVLPCVAYVTYKIIKKKKYNEAFANYDAELTAYIAKKNELLKQMEDVALESRGIFFSQNNQ